MEVANQTRGLKVVPSNLGSQRIGGQWRENEVLPENPYCGRTHPSSDVRSLYGRETLSSPNVP
jgi:hypothetical protein